MNRMALLAVPETILPSEQVGKPRAALLGRGVILLIWDVPEAFSVARPLSLSGGVSIVPTASLRLNHAGGGTRLLWALRRPESDPLQVTLSMGTLGKETHLAIEIGTQVPKVSVDELFHGLNSVGRSALVATLINVWTGLFRLQRDSAFIRTVRHLLLQNADGLESATIVARATGDLVLLKTFVPSRFGKIDAMHCIDRDGIHRLQGIPHRASSRQREADTTHILAAKRLLTRRKAYLVFSGPAGLLVRSIEDPSASLPSLTGWLREHAHRAPGLRELLLIDIAHRSEPGRAVALEAQLVTPLAPRRVAIASLNAPAAPSADITCALSTSSGTLVAGWYRDPVNLVAGIAAVSPDGSVQDLTQRLHRYPVSIDAADGGAPVNGTGFAALAPSVGGSAPILQPRFRLLLKSGAYHPLIPSLQPSAPVEARAAALRAIPPQHVDDALLSNVLAPVIADLHAQVGAGIGPARVCRIGSRLSNPKASVVIPLYKVIDFVRFQLAAFATDVWFRKHAELVYVLDSPEQETDVEHLLSGLYLVYGMPVTLVIMDRNGGYARACNAGAAAARGKVFAMVNSDIIPTATGWLEKLVARLDTRRRIGAVGPKLLFEDGSIQHAGMHFERDHRGRWLNQHYHKGMPRHYGPASEERLVPAVTGACLVTPRALFERVGGFTDDYVIGDYEDSDLCLKISQAGRKISYVPEVELYHLERKSMSLNMDYMRGIAWQYNCALHAGRWGQLMQTIMNPNGLHGSRRNKVR
jgi:O-antigen biosynthesis protein